MGSWWEEKSKEKEKNSSPTMCKACDSEIRDRKKEERRELPAPGCSAAVGMKVGGVPPAVSALPTAPWPAAGQVSHVSSCR